MKRKTPAAAKPNAALGPQDWIEAACNLLAAHGVDAVRVEPLAKSLRVTKGSFYWHFENRDALLDAILVSWQSRLTLAVIERLNASGASPAERLHALFCLRSSGTATARDAKIELALRLWARSNDRAKKAIRATDDLRLKYFVDLFAQLGNGPEAARAKALLAYGYMRTATSPQNRQSDAELASVEAVLLS